MIIGLTTTSFRIDQGAEKFVVNLAHGLLLAGHTVHVIGRLEHKPSLEQFLDQLSPQQQKAFHFHRVRTLKAHRYPNLLTFAWSVHRILKNLDLDVTQGFGKSLGIDVFRQPTASYKSLLKITNGKIKSRQAAKLELDIEKRLFYEQSKAVVVNSNYAKQSLLDAYPDIKIPIRIIYNMVDAEGLLLSNPEEERAKLRQKLGIPPDAVVFLHASTNFRLKGAPEALAGLQYLVDQGSMEKLDKIYFLLVGEEYPIPQSLATRVVACPRTKDIRPYYAASDVLLHPTRFDPFANVVLEAICSGIPAISSRMNGSAEIIKDGRTGLVLDDISPATVADSIYQIVEGLDLDTLKLNTRNTAPLFSLESVTEKFISLYQEVIEQKREHRPNLNLHALKCLMGESPI